MNVRVKNIDWCIEEEDVMDGFDYEPTQEEVQQAIDGIKADLPTDCIIDVDGDDFYDDRDEAVCEALSDQYGWLVNSFEIDDSEATMGMLADFEAL